LVVSEWIRGGSLQEVADTAPSPVGAAGAMQSLAAAAEAAHQGGMALSIDHPSRVRVSTNGHVALAFPATTPTATPHDDVAGIGAALYTLLVNRWPLPQLGMPGGLARGEVDPQGRAEKPAALKPEIPFLISVAAAGAVRTRGGIQSASTVLTLLQLATDEADQAEPKCAAGEVIPLPPPGCYAGFRDSQPTEEAAARHRKGVLAGLGAGAAVVVVVMMLASTLSRVAGNGDDGVVLDKDKLGLHTASSTPTSPATVGGLVKPVQATVFSPGGAADGPQSAGLAIDGDPATAWSTDEYSDAVPFPTFKDGVGLLLRLPQPTALSAVTVDLDSTGTVLQIRSSPSATPTRLADTTELTLPTRTRPGHNSIGVDNRAATPNVVVWISTLGTTDGESRSDISEITLQAASPGT
jgi:putative peptidoglycan lipid II flippase